MGAQSRKPLVLTVGIGRVDSVSKDFTEVTTERCAGTEQVRTQV